MYLENPYFLALGLLALPLLYRAFRNPERKWKIVNICYASIVILLAIGAASPAVQQSVEQVERKELVYLDDRSRSMISAAPNVSMDGVSVRRETLVSGNDTGIDTALMGYVEPNKSYLVRSDFQTNGNLERVRRAFEQRNSTINVLETELPEENSVSVSGPAITVPGAENTYTAELSSTYEGEKQLKVTVDGEEVESEVVDDQLRFRHNFEEDGYHRITAEVQTQDEYSSNNRYYKSVKTVEKPELLVIGDSGELDNQMSEFFEITRRDTVPEDLSEYYSVILKEKIDDTSNLKPYLIEGNGLIYTGDGSMEILPVEKTKTQEGETENAKLVVLIDISVASGRCAEETCLSEESRSQASIKPSKELAYNIIHNLPRSTRVGLAAYNDQPYNVSEVKSLAFYREELKNKVSRIQVSGPSLHHTGLQGARKKVGDTGNIVMITDGEVTDYGRNQRVRQNSYEIAESLPADVKLFTVGVGDDVNEKFLSELSDRGNGAYYLENEFYSSVPMFRGGGGAQDTEALSIVNPNHFITEDMGSLGAVTSRFDQVKPKSSAKSLVTSTGGKPVLTSWRYGLGRVASFSAGDRDLSNILSQEPQLVARSVSWASGNPQRKENGTVDIGSGRLGDSVMVSADFPLEGLSRKSENRYSTGLTPETTGFHSYHGHEFDYNYDEEVEELGYNREAMRSLTSGTGGEILSREEVDSLSSEVPTVREKVTESRSLSSYFLIAALIIFLAQVGYRKLNGLI